MYVQLSFFGFLLILIAFAIGMSFPDPSENTPWRNKDRLMLMMMVTGSLMASAGILARIVQSVSEVL